MELIKKEITPADEWTASLNATCNRLTTQYMNLLKSASSISALNINITNTNGAGGSGSGSGSSSGNHFDDTATTAATSGGNGDASSSGATTTTSATSATLPVVAATNSTTTTTSTISNVAQQHDPRAGGGYMTQNDMVAPPPLAADVAIHTTVQCQLCIENICVATSQLLNLIRTLRLSLLLMDQETMAAEEYIQVQQTKECTIEANTAAMELEYQYMDLLRKQLE